MSKVTELATGRITNTETIIVELIEANETPAVVIVRWPAKPTVIHPHRFPQCRRHRGPHVRYRRCEASPDQAGAETVTTTATGLEQIRDRLMAEAERPLTQGSAAARG